MALGLILGWVGSAACSEPGEVAYAGSIGPLVKQFCQDCHGEFTQEALVRFDTIERFEPQERNLWTMVYEKVRAREMPPADAPQPSAAQKQSLLDWIVAEQRAAPTSGTRRLNRRELAAALRDVTGLPIDYRDALPGDGRLAGFDTGAEALQDAADSVSQVLVITRRAVDAIRFLEADPAETFHVDLRETKDPRREFDAWKDRGGRGRGDMIARPGLGVLTQPKWLGERGGISIQVPAPEQEQGVLRLRFAMRPFHPIEGLPHSHLWVRVSGKDLAFEEVTQPRTFDYWVQLDDLAISNGTINITLTNLVEMPYAVEGFENDDRTKPEDNIPGGGGLFRPTFDRRAVPIEEHPLPYLVLEEITLDVGTACGWPPAEWGHDLGPAVDQPEYAQALLAVWMERAWRRDVSPDEQQRFLDFYTELRDQGLGFDEALRAVFQSVLMSGPFRYLLAPDTPEVEHRSFALASRLSFLLTGEPPDATLRELARQGRLLEPDVLDAQVDRLLADPRGRRFVEPFVKQWLVMDQPITIAMSHLQKQDFRFARFLKQSMQDETLAYVATLLAENRPAGELLASDWTMMNNALARHYGYDPLPDGQLRKVSLREDDPRGGGILSHAGIQSMLCWMGENWVIYRGAWALRHILDMPPPPPPLEVPELDPSESANQGKSFRELLKQHQEDSRCSVCHKAMDPLGFAFQNFDISGRWRNEEFERYTTSELDGKIAWRGSGASRPVDAAGQLPRGERFENYAEFQQLLVTHYREDLVRGLLKNLVIYATGRLPDVDDMHEIRAIIDQHRPRDFPARDLIKALVRSRAFLGERERVE